MLSSNTACVSRLTEYTFMADKRASVSFICFLWLSGIDLRIALLTGSAEIIRRSDIKKSMISANPGLSLLSSVVNVVPVENDRDWETDKTY
jgi:hypothetical protein